ncbi:hypothetical protein N2152v2_005009 [Parachlorella kessleri]
MKAHAFFLLAALVCGAAASLNTGQEDLNQIGLPVHATLELTGPEEDLAGNGWASSYGEGRSLLATYTPTPTKYRFRVDSFAQNGLMCANFKNNAQYVAAVRIALRTTASDVATELGLTPGVDYDVVSLATGCTMPPDGITGPGKNRKRLRVSIVLTLMSNMPGDFLSKLTAKVQAGVYKNYAAQLGADKWTPMPFTYNNGRNAVCLPKLAATYGLCGTAAWRPNQITPI